MMDDSDIKFIMALKVYVQQKPHMVSALVEVIQDGITSAFKEASERAADMETTAAMALNARLFKGNETFIADKLEKWKGKTALRWDDQLAALRRKTK
jgi:phage shock protein A